MITVKKGDRTRVVTQDQLHKYVADGYEVVPQKILEPSAKVALTGEEENLTYMEKDGRVRAVQAGYVKTYEDQGYVKVENPGELREEYLEGRDAGEGEKVPAVREGSGDSGDPVGERSGPAAAPKTDDEQAEGGEDLAAAIRSLDPSDDTFWTAREGHPKAHELSKIVGRTVSQEEARNAIPGFTRDNRVG